ncbi:hypothetical protein PR202_gb25338 [Eleusine coracana subsp. coracana]|uniref:Glycosyl-hydrolase family 116 catalytic region domain-containing protein n=1 Tax=Eleusine coracana subsp. coracana TaxID=191504 RepID=A0AAV5FPB7_ELECO|nr:hypothetical protein PR202_gb25338 [Eleusine coracana subsp. coracana]
MTSCDEYRNELREWFLQLEWIFSNVQHISSAKEETSITDISPNHVVVNSTLVTVHGTVHIVNSIPVTVHATVSTSATSPVIKPDDYEGATVQAADLVAKADPATTEHAPITLEIVHAPATLAASAPSTARVINSDNRDGVISTVEDVTPAPSTEVFVSGVLDAMEESAMIIFPKVDASIAMEIIPTFVDNNPNMEAVATTATLVAMEEVAWANDINKGAIVFLDTTPNNISHPLIEVTVAIMGGLRRVTGIFSILHDNEGLYDILHDDVIINVELSFLAARISSDDTAPSWSLRDGLIFFDGCLYITASSARLHGLLTVLLKHIEEALLRQVAVGFRGLPQHGPFLPRGILFLQEMPNTSIDVVDVRFVDLAGNDLFHVRQVAFTVPDRSFVVIFIFDWSVTVKLHQPPSVSLPIFSHGREIPQHEDVLVLEAGGEYKHWEEEIDKWQTPILHDDRLPEWYKITLFNELYFLVAGGTVWIDSDCLVVNDDDKLNPSLPEDSDCSSAVPLIGFTKHEIDNKENVGKFLYLEGVEYFMWCTYDVHFYASFALLDLFPKIELSIQRDFARAVLREDKTRVRFLADGTWGTRKVIGAVAHDLGAHDPWHELNAYNIHDTSRWKDLNPKFVLQIYRDFAATGDISFCMDVWPAVCTAMEYMGQFDHDGDDMIENDGFPDQTYDAWTVQGVSAYCGCLWLAALQAAATLARSLGHDDYAERCMTRFTKAKSVFEARLWNGSYFNYDSGTSYSSRSIPGRSASWTMVHCIVRVAFLV